MARSRIDEILADQAEDLAKLQQHQVAAVLRAYEDARRELYERLASIDPELTRATAQRIRVSLAQVEAGIAAMRARLGQALGDAEQRMHDRGLQNLIDTVRQMEPEFRDTGARIEVRTVRHLAEQRALLLHEHSVHRYGLQLVDEIQRRVVSGVVQGLSPLELARSIAGADGFLAANRHRCELIARMEIARSYDVGHRESIDAWAAMDDPADPDPALKRADEFFDHRTHPFSRALHGKYVRPSEEFEVAVSEVRGTVRGVVWQRTGSVFHGMGMPAHYNERGRVTPYRCSWEGKAFVEPVSKRAKPLTERDEAGLRKIDRDEPHALTPAGQRRARGHGLATVHDGELKLTSTGRDHVDGGTGADRLRPSMPPDPKREPRGTHNLDGRKPTDPSVVAERWVAKRLSQDGYDVEHIPRSNKRTPDYHVEGKPVDTYRSTGSDNTARREISAKVKEGKPKIVLWRDKEDYDEILARLQRHPVDGLEELFVVKGGQIVRVIG